VTETAWVPQVFGGEKGRDSTFFRAGKKKEIPFLAFSISDSIVKIWSGNNPFKLTDRQFPFAL
jgi:hypothetical protein